MSGEEVKIILKNNGYTLKSVAIKLGETPQNLQSMLNAADIKTGVLERISKAINKNLYFFYRDLDIANSNNVVEEGTSDYLNGTVGELRKEVDYLKKDIKTKDKLIGSLEEQIRLMKK